MTEKQGTVAIIGTGVIGGSWAAAFLAAGYGVSAFDPAPEAQERLIGLVEQAWPVLARLGAAETAPLDQLSFMGSAAEAAQSADFVQESGPEDPAVKAALMVEVDAAARPNVVIASSSSGLMPSVIAAMCEHHPERVLVGHPFNPPHLIPVVEVVPGEHTSAAAVEEAMRRYTALGKRPVLVRREQPGHIGNRLQMALWREAFSLVESGVATTADIDAIVTGGPGLRWAALGPFAGLQMSGGEGGIAHNLTHMRVAITQWWATLGDPTLDDELISILANQVNDQFRGHDIVDVARARDLLIADVVAWREQQHDLP